MRLRRVILGHCSASLAAALVLVVCSSFADWHGLRPAVIDLFDLSVFIFLYALTPAFLALTYAALSGIRSPWYYVLAGIGTGLFFPLLVRGIVSVGVPIPWSPGWLYMLTVVGLGGMVGGFVFWGLVGRKYQVE
jgi:hypothetical protein